MSAPLSAGYVPRPALDAAIARCLASGQGAYALEGPGGAGKSAALLHGLVTERERRGKAGRGFVRILQLWGDEAPSEFARRLVREVGLLNWVPYPQPAKLAHLAADMAQQIPGMSQAGKLLAALLPDDMRPLPTIAAQALAESGERSLASGGPLCIGIDLLGGEVSPPVRDFFTRLCDQLPPTVVLLFAHPGGHNSLAHVPVANRLPAGPFTAQQASEFLEDRLGRLDHESVELLRSGRLSLLPGDLSQIVNLYPLLGRDPRAGLSAVAGYLERDITTRYQMMFELGLSRSDADPRLLELCALVAVTTRPQQPLSVPLALRRLGGEGADGVRESPLRPIELSQLRQMPLLRALCATMAPLGGTAVPDESLAAETRSLIAPLDADRKDPGRVGPALPADESVAGDFVGWPLVPANAQARDGVCNALARHGLLDVYQQRWLSELLSTLRQTSGREALLAGMTAISLLSERATREPQALGQALQLLSEMEVLFWRAGWHRTFAELFDSLASHVDRFRVSVRDVAPKLWFRRARARVQTVDWSQATGQAAASTLPSEQHGELAQAIAELGALLQLSEESIVQARAQLGLTTEGHDVLDWCLHLPFKARQARGYAQALGLLLAPAHRAESAGNPTDLATDAAAVWQAALDDILRALAHFVAHQDAENIAQTLTILGDLYSARQDERSEASALAHYEQAVAVASRVEPPIVFTVGVIHRSWASHHLRRGQQVRAAEHIALARRHLLRSPDARMGTLLARLLPDDRGH